MDFPRSSFLSDGFFRITQPKYLNDKGSEGQLYPYFNEFSPADLAWARKQHDKIQVNPLYEPSEEQLINANLRPMGTRKGEIFPHFLKSETGFGSMEEYDRHQYEDGVIKINEFLLEALSCQLGVLSLCKSDTSVHMWNFYGSEGKGIAITFNEEHPFFQVFIPKDVSYTLESRAMITYFKGSWRLNGEPIDNYRVSEYANPLAMHKELVKQGIDVDDLSNRLLFSKSDDWDKENEIRIICPLELCEKTNDEAVTPNVQNELVPNLLTGYSKVCLKMIPFDAFESIVFGYETDACVKNEIINKINDNPLLSHLKIKEVVWNLEGKLDTRKLTVST